MLTRLLIAAVCAIGLTAAPASARVVVVHGFHGRVFHPGFHPFFHGPRAFFRFGFAPVPVAPYYPYPYAYYPPPPPYPYYYPYAGY